MYSHAVHAEPIHPRHAPEIIRLRDEIDLLREENRQLRDQIGASDDALFARHCRELFFISKSRARLLSILMAGKTQSREGIWLAYCNPAKDRPDIKIIDQQICSLRAALRPHGITIENVRCHGYHMSNASKALVTSLLTEWEALQ